MNIKSMYIKNAKKTFQIAGVILAILILYYFSFLDIHLLLENSYIISTKSNPTKAINFNLFSLYNICFIGFCFGMFLVYLFNFIFNRKNVTSFWFTILLFFLVSNFFIDLVLKFTSSKFSISLFFLSADLAKITLLIIILEITNAKMPFIYTYIIGSVFLSWLILVISLFFSFSSFTYPLHAFCTLILYFAIFKSMYEGYKKAIIGKIALYIVMIILILAVLMIIPSEKLISVGVFNLRILGNIFLPIFLVIFISYLFAKDYSNLLNRQEEVKKLTEEKNIILEKQNEILALQVAEKTAELQKLNSTKDKLFSIIAHDLRSPMASIKGILQLFNNKSLSHEDFVELSKHLQQNVDNIHNMLENLLFWSLSQMNGIKPNLQKFDINDIIVETTALFKEVANQKQIDLKINVSEALLTFADENQIQTVLRNLVNNAIKFTPQHGHVAITGGIRENFVLLKIADSGTGIRQEDLPTIFTNPKLNRGTIGEKGTGLGLVLCKDLIERNGGKIVVRSEYEKGTTFEILLPNT